MQVQSSPGLMSSGNSTIVLLFGNSNTDYFWVFWNTGKVSNEDISADGSSLQVDSNWNFREVSSWNSKTRLNLEPIPTHPADGMERAERLKWQNSEES